jgi:hypothetical protein
VKRQESSSSGNLTASGDARQVAVKCNKIKFLAAQPAKRNQSRSMAGKHFLAQQPQHDMDEEEPKAESDEGPGRQDSFHSSQGLFIGAGL